MGRTSQIAAFCCAATLAGCGTDPVIPAVVNVPVAVSCVKDAPEKPQTAAEGDILHMDEYRATLTTWVERLALKSYAEKAEAVIAACR